MKLLKVSALCAAAVIALAGCNKNEVVNNLIPSDMETAYAKVKISMAGATGTRAFGNENGAPAFDYGSAEEAAVKNITLLLLSGETVVGVGSVGAFTFDEVDHSDEGPTNDNVSHKGKTGVIKVTLDPGSAKPDKLLAFVNTNATFANLEEAQKAVTAFSDIKANGFVMTNSAFYNGEEWVDYTAVAEDQLFYTETDAAKAEGDQIIDIYVERLAAKVSTSIKEGADKSFDKLVGYDGETTYSIEFDAWRWAVTGYAKTMNTLKQAYGTTGFGWAEGTNRSYWAKGVHYTATYGEYQSNGSTLLTYLTANQLISENGTKKRGITFGGEDYTTEHTFGEEAIDEDGVFAPKITGTNAIIVGQYKVLGDDADEKFLTEAGEYDFYLALSGDKYIIYSAADLIDKVLSMNGFDPAKFTNEDEEGVTAEDLTKYLKPSKNNEGNYTLEVLKTLYYAGSEDAFSVEDLTASKAKHYLNGWAYFLAPIEHNYVDDKTVGSYGVVRNHSYVLTINSITGLGAPLDEGKIGEDPKNSDPIDPENPDPEDPEPGPGDDPIVPDPDEIKDAYISATLNVLSWHVVSQTVDL